MEQEWGRTNIPEIEKSRMALGTAWVHCEKRARGAYGAQSGGAGPSASGGRHALAGIKTDVPIRRMSAHRVKLSKRPWCTSTG